MPDAKPQFPVLSIVGTTSVGKTEVALEIAHTLALEDSVDGVDIISADSKQVFQDLEILTGADIPEGFSRVRDTFISNKDFFQKDKIRLFGVSMIEPSDDWSVGQFQEYSHEIMRDSHQRQHAIIIVGGTGLFHKHLFNDDPTLQISPNEELRAKAEVMSVEELQQWLQQLDEQKYTAMNDSDRQNPRRLVRAIEVASAQPAETTIKPLSFVAQQYYLGLSLPTEIIEEKISARVQSRFERAKAEVTALVGEDTSNTAAATLGFSQLQQLLSEEISEEECLAIWTTAERQYAKRQLTWWRTVPDIKWFEVQDSENRSAAIKYGCSVLQHAIAPI